MGNKYMDTTLFDKAAEFAIKAHSNSERRGHGTPYALHVFEAAAVCETMTQDQEILAAALLHDTIEDTDVTLEELRENFGERVASLVNLETTVVEDGESDVSSWKRRKQAAIDCIAAAPRDAKIVALGDKLSNIRAIYREFMVQGDELWNIFHNNDPLEHEWHYRGLAAALYELKDTAAYKEFIELIYKTFEKYHEKPTRLNLDEWVVFGDGYTASSYNKIDDDSVMMKLYEPIVYVDFVERELNAARMVQERGIPSPAPRGLVSAEGKYGVCFERLAGKKSFARAMSENPERTEELAVKFARMAKDLHRKEADTTLFASAREVYGRLIDSSSIFTDAERARAHKILEDTQDVNTFLHGDLHMGNVLETAKSGDVFIDLADFSYGDPIFDLGTVYFTCCCNPEFLSMKLYHCNNEQLGKFFDYFISEYWSLKTREEIDEAKKKLAPFAGLRLLNFMEAEHNSQKMKDQIFSMLF